MVHISNLAMQLAIGHLADAVNTYKAIGAFKITILIFIEAFIPVIPLCALVILNAATYGFLKGFLISYIGSVSGNWALYAVFYYCGHFRFFSKIRQKEKIKKYADWLENKGFFLMALCCFVPIIINSIVAMLAGLNRISFRKFAAASALGIFGLFFILSIIGISVTNLSSNRWEILYIILLVAMLAVVGKIVQAYLIRNKKA
ncbi:TVP38/TMEM64 family protein [Bacillus sp. 1P06AnD]|uniref:TVP38/TMEM64 family protein n=1 Tax=Bacillus sp. 1P06AnD TaxID=3132208 RepID=UPI0039A17E51